MALSDPLARQARRWARLEIEYALTEALYRDTPARLAWRGIPTVCAIAELIDVPQCQAWLARGPVTPETLTAFETSLKEAASC